MSLAERIYISLFCAGILFTVAAFITGRLCEGLSSLCRIRRQERLVSLSPVHPFSISATLMVAGIIGIITDLFMQLNPLFSFFATAICTGAFILFIGNMAAKGFNDAQGMPEIREALLLGARVEVTKQIEPGGEGAVVLVADGVLSTHPARAADAVSTIPKGSLVSVLRVEEGTAYVKLVE